MEDDIKVTQEKEVAKTDMVKISRNDPTTGELETMEVHPATLADHLVFGWKEVA